MSAPCAPVLELSGIEHSFLTLRVLKGIDLAVAAGEIVGYVGANGAGKTTTLNIAATLLRPTRGQVRIMGQDALREPATVRPRLGLMPEQFGVYDDMRVAEYLDFFAEAYRMPADARKERVSAWTREAGLEPRQALGSLSKGTKQRLFFARTLLHAPSLALLDEPFAGMDPAATAWTIEAVRRHATAGTAFVISSHDLGELQRVATRIVGLKSGYIVSAAPAPETARFRIRVDGDLASARAAAEVGFPGALVRVDGNDRFELRLTDPPRDNDVLRMLLEAGVPVAGFEKQAIAVEEIYGTAPGGTS